MNLYIRDNIAQKVSMLSLYMIYGGTNWGWLSVPFVPTSYDYSAAIAEDRSLRQKYYELKLIALFVRASRELPGTWRNGYGTSYTNDSAVFTTELLNANTSSRFYVTRHAITSDGSALGFKLNITTSAGNFTVPQYADSIQLSGHVSKIIPTDFHFGQNTLIYATAEVLTHGTFDGISTIAFWLAAGESGEVYIKSAKSGKVLSCNGCSSMDFRHTKDGLILTFTQGIGMSVVTLNTGLRILIMDRIHAYSFWVPSLSDDPVVDAAEVAFVSGPYLVRSAVTSGHTITIRGDVNATTELELFASSKVTTVKWNGKTVPTTRTRYGSLKASLPGPKRYSLPKFGPWIAHDSLPEKSLNYDDTGTAWVEANKNTTVNSRTSSFLPYLYIDEYGFHTGVHLWRGYFNGSTNVTGVYLTIQGGDSFGYSAYLNGGLLGSYYGDATSASASLSLSFNSTVNNDQNVLLVIQDNSGHEEGSSVTSPRGIFNATLIGGDGPQFESWKVTGTAGGSQNKTVDAVRTIYNEGGLTAERLGWHLPSLPSSITKTWTSASPSQGFQGSTVMFYRSTLDLSGIPSGHDVGIHFNLTPINQSTNGKAPFRALLYVNGYQYGRFNPHVRDTNPYPVPPGILNYGGQNTIALAVWAQTVEGASVELTAELGYVVESGLNTKFDGSYLRPGWTKERLEYA